MCTNVVRSIGWVSLLVVWVIGCGYSPGEKQMKAGAWPDVATFSIVAHDPETGELGVAVQSKFIAVGSVVPWAEAGVGAIATQARANTTFGPRGLELLKNGEAPKDVVSRLVSRDEGSEHRQIGIVGAEGRSANFTGEENQSWAGGVEGDHFCVQGNILAGEDVVRAMAKRFRTSDGPLAERMIEALQAGQKRGGDRRGKQSAALLVVREDWGYGGFNDRFRDLRVDDHKNPIEELSRVYQLHRNTFPRPASPEAPKNEDASGEEEEKEQSDEPENDDTW